MGDYTIARIALHGIITAKRLLYFKWRSPRPSWLCQLPQPAKPPIIPFHTLCSWY